MFVFSFKISKPKIIKASIILAILFFLLLLFNHKQIISNTSSPVNSNSIITSPVLKTNQDRIAFLNSLKLEVSKQPIEVVQVIIPKEFDKVFNNYNELQKSSGFDLMRYRNIVSTRYTYQVYNLKHLTKDDVRVNLFIYKDKVIAGDISSVKLDGFMVALNHFLK